MSAVMATELRIWSREPVIETADMSFVVFVFARVRASDDDGMVADGILGWRGVVWYDPLWTASPFTMEMSGTTKVKSSMIIM